MTEKEPGTPLARIFANVLIRLGRDYPLERDVAVLHDDMNRRNSLYGVPLQGGRAVDCPVGRQTDSIIMRRRRQNFDVIHNGFDPFDPLHD